MRIPRLVLAVSVVAVGLSLGPSASALALPAAPSTSYFQFSTNGSTWSSTPPPAMFPAAYRIVPGDSETATLFIRSTRAAPTAMSAAIVDIAASDPGFGRAVTVQATGADGTTISGSADSLPSCAPIFSDVRVEANRSVRIAITMTMLPTLTALQEQGSRLSFDLLVALADPGAPVADGCFASGTTVPAFPGRSGSAIAFTGTDTLSAGLVFASFLVGVGAVILLVTPRARRRRNRQP